MLVTYTGKFFDYNNMNKDMIDIDDVIRSLVRINRFVGHSSRAYSVGEHSFYCMLMAEKLGFTYREQLLALTHDFTEAYVGDCPSPLKRLLPNFADIEARVEEVICEHMGIKPPTEEEWKKVKGIDMTMLVIEMQQLTLHKTDTHIGEWTHHEMLDDEEFILGEGMSEKMLSELLRELYDYLIVRVKDEE